MVQNLKDTEMNISKGQTILKQTNRRVYYYSKDRPPPHGEEPGYGDGYDNPKRFKKSQAYKDAMAQGTEEILQIFNDIDTYTPKMQVKVS